MRQHPPRHLPWLWLNANGHHLPLVRSFCFRDGAVANPAGRQALRDCSKGGLVGAGERHRMSRVGEVAWGAFARCVHKVRGLEPWAQVATYDAVVGEVRFSGPDGNGLRGSWGHSRGRNATVKNRHTWARPTPVPGLLLPAFRSSCVALKGQGCWDAQTEGKRRRTALLGPF